MLECVGLLGQERWSNVKCMSHSGKWGLRDQAVHRKKVGNLNTVIKMHASYLMVTEHENWPFGWSILTGIELLILTCARFLVPIEKLVFWRKWFFCLLTCWIHYICFKSSTRWCGLPVVIPPQVLSSLWPFWFHPDPSPLFLTHPQFSQPKCNDLIPYS